MKRLYNFRHDKSKDTIKSKSNKSQNEIADEVVEGVSLDDIKLELMRILEEKPEGYKFIAQELKIKIDEHRRRQKRSVTDNNETPTGLGEGENGKDQRKVNKNYKKHLNKKINVFRANMNKPKESKKYKRRVPSTNRDYMPVELISQANSDVTSGLNPLPENYIEMLEMVPGVVQVKDKFSSLLTWFTQEPTADNSSVKKINESEEEEEEELDEDDSKNVGDRVYLDYRESGCLTVPRNQDECGSCYAFAATSLMEWLNCNQTGELVPFSEQYMIDCGFHVDLDGCDGGDYYGIYKFAVDWGVELLANYPYMARENKCPYDANEWEKAGHKKPVVLRKDIANDRGLWANTLKTSGPLLISINVPLDFHLYGGGVHDGRNCSLGDEDLHAMLLVGHGVDDEQDYWLIRNSHGHEWGESGYFKLSKDADDICFDSGRLMTYDFVKEPPPSKEIRTASGKKRKLSPSELEEKIYADILLYGYTDLKKRKSPNDR